MEQISEPQDPAAPGILAPPPDVDGAPVAAPRKFDLGLAAAPAVDGERHIPWGHGQDRVTAMVVDPERLYVYWEVTDEAIAGARAGLGPGGPGAHLTLRVYDVTNRIFDGTNAHHYFDHTVARTDRQWFFFIGRPSATVVVELGLKSDEGYFVRVARSGRADFPRRQPAPGGRVEWLTVRSATGAVDDPAVESRASLSGPGGGSAAPGPAHERDGGWAPDGFETGWMREARFVTAWAHWGEWSREWRIEWAGPIVRTTWDAGPFPFPVEPPRYVEERYEGALMVRQVGGRAYVVHGPWQVIIRGLAARAERQVLAVWEIYRSWPAGPGVAARVVGASVGAPGASETILGASELRWAAASELRLGGASERYWLGASELRLGGASERSWIGASEQRYLGASETLWGGASEWRARGASERVQLGASEWLQAGASERLYPGASERAWPGASEQRPRYPAAPWDPPAPGG